MKPLQNFWNLAALITGLCLSILLVGCGTPPLVQPKSDVPAAQTTAATPQPVSTATAESETTASPESVTESAAPESPLATPPSVPAMESPTAVLETPASSSNEIEYAAEKISLAPVNLSVDLPGISAQDAELSQINFGGWSNSGRQFAFAILFPDGSAEQWLANMDGTGLKKIDETGSCGLRRWSPDDSQLLCYKYEEDGFPTDEIWIIQVDTNEWLKIDEPPGVKIDDTDVYGANIAWVDDQHLLYPTYSKIEPEARRLWLHNVQSQEITEVVIDQALKNKPWRDLELAPNKKSIVGGVGTPKDTLWLGELVQENEQWRLDDVKTLIANEVVVSFWSADSAKLAIKSLSHFSSESELRMIDLHSNQELTISFPGKIATVNWSSDSQSLIVSLYGAGTELPNPVYVVNADGSNLQPLGDFFFGHMTWSPTGEYLGLFLSDDTNSHNPFGIIKVEVSQ